MEHDELLTNGYLCNLNILMQAFSSHQKYPVFRSVLHSGTPSFPYAWVFLTWIFIQFFLSSSYWWNSNGIFWTFNKCRQYNFFSVGKLHLKVVDLYNTPKHDLVTSDDQILTLATFVVYIRNDGWQTIYLYVSFMVHTHNSDMKFIPRAPGYR